MTRTQGCCCQPPAPARLGRRFCAAGALHSWRRSAARSGSHLRRAALRRYPRRAGALRKGRARPRERTEITVYRTLHAQADGRVLAQHERALCRHRHADHRSRRLRHHRQGLPQHPGRSGWGAGRRSHRGHRHIPGQRLEDAAGAEQAAWRSGHVGLGHVRPVRACRSPSR